FEDPPHAAAATATISDKRRICGRYHPGSRRSSRAMPLGEALAHAARGTASQAFGAIGGISTAARTAMPTRRLPIGAEVVAGGADVRVWAPGHRTVTVVIESERTPRAVALVRGE